MSAESSDFMKMINPDCGVQLENLIHLKDHEHHDKNRAMYLSCASTKSIMGLATSIMVAVIILIMAISTGYTLYGVLGAILIVSVGGIGYWYGTFMAGKKFDSEVQEMTIKMAGEIDPVSGKGITSSRDPRYNAFRAESIKEEREDAARALDRAQQDRLISATSSRNNFGNNFGMSLFPRKSNSKSGFSFNNRRGGFDY